MSGFIVLWFILGAIPLVIYIWLRNSKNKKQSPLCRGCKGKMFGGGEVHDYYWICMNCNFNEKYDEKMDEYFHSTYKENIESRDKQK